MQKATICLNMIVKNEADIIEDTLDNIRRYLTIDYMVICDTGSTDQTIQRIASYGYQHQIVTEIYQHTWVDFAYNRNQALQLCSGKSDYILIFDADDRFQGELDLPSSLEHDIYHFTFKSDARDFFYTRKILIKNNDLVHWVGVLHESLVNTVDGLSEREVGGNYYIQTGHFGHRNQNPNKYLDDAITLACAYEKETDPLLKARYAYYCATSYYSCNHIDEAIDWFKCRINLTVNTGNDIERYLACRYLGSIYKQQKAFEKAIFIWLKGASIAPHYLECLYEVSLLYTELGDAQIAYDLALLAQQKLEYEHATALERNIMIYGIDYQILSLGIHLEKFKTAYQAWNRLMTQPNHSDELTKFLTQSEKYFKS